MSWIEDPGEFQDYDFSKLKVDEAYLNINSDEDGSLYYVSNDCYHCDYEFLSKMNTRIILNVAHNGKFKVLDETNSTICEDIEHPMDEFGIYDIQMKDKKCDLKTLKEPVNIYLPILIVFFILCGIFILTQAFSFIKKKYFKSNDDSISHKGPVKRRVKALDTFRGMSIVLMIFVNDGGGKYWWIEHATWNGLTVGDLVFPFFLWIMGVCIPISTKSLISKSVPIYTSLLNIFQRSCKLFLIGVALGTLWPITLEKMRIFGVLQRFGISYFIVASLVLLLHSKTKESKNKLVAIFQDVYQMGWLWLIMMVLVATHLAITFALPVPDCPTGYLGPGGRHEYGKYNNCIGGATKYIDAMIIGERHLYQNPTANPVYKSGSFDPEGFFGCILSVVHVFFGVQAGITLLHFQEWKQIITRWLCWGCLTGIIGGVLCGFSKEDGIIPVNKNMWSLSYLLVTTSFSFILLSVCYILIDVMKLWNGSPFIQPGMNAIIMYIGHSMCFQIFPFHWAIQNMNTHFIYLLESVWGTILWVLVAFELVRKKIFFVL